MRIREFILTLFIVCVCSALILKYHHSYQKIGKIDYAQYWAAAKLFVSQSNPYVGDNLLKLQKLYLNFNDPIYMWNPPIVFGLILPLAYLDFESGRILNFIFGIVGLSFSLFILWKEFLPTLTKQQRYGIICILASFPAFYPLLYFGQISYFLLLGLTLYLYFKKRQSYFWAGLVLTLTCIKPHLLYLFYIFEFWQFIKSKNYLPLLGLTCGLVVLVIIPSCINFKIWDYYFTSMSSPPFYWITTTLGSFLRLLFNSKLVILGLIPTLLSILILGTALIFDFKQTKLQNFNYLLIPLSLLTAPYGWVFDQVLLLPSIFVAIRLILNQHFLVKAIILTIIHMLALFHAEQTAQHVLVWYTFLVCMLSSFIFLRQNH